MPKLIQLDGVGTVEFPDDATEAEMRDAAESLIPLPSAKFPPSVADEPVPADDGYVSHPALPLPTTRPAPSVSRSEYDYLPPLPPITDAQLAGQTTPSRPGLFESFNRLGQPVYDTPTEPPVDVMSERDKAAIEDAQSRLLLSQRVQRVAHPVSEGARESIAEGTRALASNTGLAALAGMAVAPEFVGPALFATTLPQVPERIEQIQRAREEGDRADYYRAVFDAAQTAGILAGTARPTARAPSVLDAWRDSVAARAEARFNAARNITPRAPSLLEPPAPRTPPPAPITPRPPVTPPVPAPEVPPTPAEAAEMTRVRAMPETPAAEAQLVAEDLAKAVADIDVSDLAGSSPVPALVRLIRRAARDPAMKTAAEQAMQKVGDAARAQGVPLDTIKTQLAGELQAVYGADAPEMARYYFGEEPAKPAALPAEEQAAAPEVPAARVEEAPAAQPAEPAPTYVEVTHFSPDPARKFTAERHAYFHPTEHFDPSNLPAGGKLFRGRLTLRNPKTMPIEQTMDLSADAISRLKAQGYDGVVSADGSEIVAFDPTAQFKESAPAEAPAPREPWQLTRSEAEGAAQAGTHYFDSLYRIGEPRTTHPFLARSQMDMDLLGTSGEPKAFHGVRFRNPLVVASRAEASMKLLGRNVYAGSGRPKVGEVSEESAAVLKADNLVGDAASKAGYDAVVTPHEIQVVDTSALPKSEPLTGQEWEGMGHRKSVERALREGKPVPPEVLADYPDLRAPAPTAPAAPTPPAAAQAKAQAEVSRVAATEGKRSAKDIKAELVARLEQAVKDAPESAATLPEAQRKVTIEIPGDGTFTVWNDKPALTGLLARAKRIETTPTTGAKVKRTGSQKPPGEIRTRSDFNDAVEFFELEDTDTLADRSNALDAFVRRFMPESNPARVTVGMVKRKLEERSAAPPTEAGEQGRTARTADPFERARRGDDAAFDDLDAQFREIYPEPEEIARPGRSDPNTVHTPQQFATRFNTAFAARDFQTILDTIKATSDVSVWKPFLKDLFAKQASDPIAAKKAEWFRHVFNGTVPPDAIPRATRPPRPSATPPPPRPGPAPRPGASAPPPGGSAPPPPPPPPSPPPVRIPVEPISGGGGKSPYRIIEDFSAAIKKSLRVLRLKRGTLGTYSPGSTRTAEKFAGDLDTAAHELAGHWTDDRYGIGKPWIAPRTRSPYDTELAKFWIHGSVTPTSTLRYRRAEGIAEFIRAYVVNPRMAKAEAPNFAAYFERTLPADALKAINDFGTDVRRWAGEDPLIRAGLNMRMEPPSLTERLWKGLRGRGFGFEVSPLDKLRMWFDDPYHYAVKAFHEMRAVRGGPLLPKDNFELQARLLSTHDARMSDQFEHGLTPLRPTQTRTPTGQLAVDRIIDPVTNEPMTLKWLLDPLDKTDKAKMNQDMRDASAYMVAQRTVEKAGKLGRASNVSGIGAGIYTDLEAAQALLNRVAADPVRAARLNEAARRYRLWADKNIDMLVDAGRLSKKAARDIRDNNEFYVDMHRLSQEFETGFRKQRGGKVGTTRDVVKRFKGSTLELDNVYSNLLEQTDAVQKEAFRNVAMNTFTDSLRNTRSLHGPDLKDFDQFGTRVSSADENTLTIYKDGKAEHWKFDPDIHESLKGLGELGTHAFIDFLALPSRFVRYMITHGPQFILRNTIRDTFERSVVSRNRSKPWDILQGYTAADLSRYEVFGGGQFGNYIIDRHVWNRELKRTMRELRKDPHNIFLSPFKLKRAWEDLSAKSEKLGRIAEFRRAFDHAQKELGYDDYNAALYAAGEARGLMDFAKAGTVMRVINRLVPFSNARVRGLARAAFAARENPGRFAMRWAMFVLLPTLAALLWNRRDKETWEEYQQLPAHQKDFFWNFKVGPYWLRIPKPHELGVMAGGVARAIDRFTGDKRAMEGWGGSVAAQALPLNTPVESVGPLKSVLELYFNKDSFQGREIVPAWEKDLKLELRKGTEHASGAAQAVASAINKTGLEVDPRQVDYLLQSLGGLGQIATDVTRRPLGESAARATGYVTGTPGASARDVQWVFNWARRNGKMNEQFIRDMTALRKAALDAKTAPERDLINAQLRQAATYLRDALEQSQ